MFEHFIFSAKYIRSLQSKLLQISRLISDDKIEGRSYLVLFFNVIPILSLICFISEMNQIFGINNHHKLDFAFRTFLVQNLTSYI